MGYCGTTLCDLPRLDYSLKIMKKPRSPCLKKRILTTHKYLKGSSHYDGNMAWQRSRRFYRKSLFLMLQRSTIWHTCYANDKECMCSYASSSSSKWEMFPLTNYMTKTFFRAKRWWWWWLYHYIVHSTRKCKNCICWKVVFLENSMVISLCANQTWNSLSALELEYCKLIISRAAVQEFKLFILSFKSRRRSL